MSEAAEYRELTKDKMPEAVRLWSAVFNVEERFFTSLLDGGEEADNVSLAAIVDGKIVSSVHIFMRLIRDREGRPLKVGGIGSVSTHDDYRKQGHSGRLLELALAAMEREGCVWSYLGTGVNDHYARYGWRTVSGPYRHAALREIAAPNGPQKLGIDDSTLDAMAPVYDEFTLSRPMARVRNEKIWRTAVRYRIDRDKVLVYGAYNGETLAAYAVARIENDTLAFIDAAALKEEETRFSELFAAIAAEGQSRGTTRIATFLPDYPDLDQAFTSIAVLPILPGETRHTMLRPIADRISWPDLLALFGDPRGRDCGLDAF